MPYFIGWGRTESFSNISFGFLQENGAFNYGVAYNVQSSTVVLGGYDNTLNMISSANNLSFITGVYDKLTLGYNDGNQIVHDEGWGTSISIGPGFHGGLTIADFGRDWAGTVQLHNQGYYDAAQVVAAERSDDHGGTLIPLANSSALHFVGLSHVDASHFSVLHT